ncbi:MAG TPA: 6-bladed beta-propeller [Bacteroidales bacterium]|nr:6-bladed beta-propeller [Bacteroidales bacterium]
MKNVLYVFLGIIFFNQLLPVELYSQNESSNISSFFKFFEAIDLDSLKLPHPNADIHFVKNLTCIADFNAYNIKCFDRNGRVRRKIGRKGRGPGEFNQLAFIDINETNNRLVALDISKRISLFDLEGNYISSFIISKPYHALDITYLDGQHIAIGGLPFNSSSYKIENNKGFVHLYEIDGEYKNSFQTPYQIEKDKISLQAINLDIIVKSDINGGVLAAQPLKYELVKHNIKQKGSKILISKVPDYVKIVDEAIPPAAISKRKIDDFWFSEDRHILSSFYTTSFGYIMKVKTFQPTMYSLDVYDRNGNPIILNISTDLNLRAVKNRKFYFTTFSEESNSYQLQVYEFNIPDR